LIELKYPYNSIAKFLAPKFKKIFKVAFTAANIGFLPACTPLASPINKIEFVVGLGRKSSLIEGRQKAVDVGRNSTYQARWKRLK
jgi:hypothetical protein